MNSFRLIAFLSSSFLLFFFLVLRAAKLDRFQWFFFFFSQGRTGNLFISSGESVPCRSSRCCCSCFPQLAFVRGVLFVLVVQQSFRRAQHLAKAAIPTLHTTFCEERHLLHVEGKIQTCGRRKVAVGIHLLCSKGMHLKECIFLLRANIAFGIPCSATTPASLKSSQQGFWSPHWGFSLRARQQTSYQERSSQFACPSSRGIAPWESN